MPSTSVCSEPRPSSRLGRSPPSVAFRHQVDGVARDGALPRHVQPAMAVARGVRRRCVQPLRCEAVSEGRADELRPERQQRGRHPELIVPEAVAKVAIRGEPSGPDGPRVVVSGLREQ
eukprot:820268-Prymnesium_polylepis.3